MKVVPLEMYEHFMATVRPQNDGPGTASSRDPVESIIERPEHMEIDPASPQISANSNGQQPEADVVKDNESVVNTFPEWKEYSDKSTQTEPKKFTRSKRPNQRRNGGTKRRRRR